MLTYTKDKNGQDILLDNNGIMFGDDYGGIKNQGVKLAVDKFCEELGRKPTIIENKWILTKKKL